MSTPEPEVIKGHPAIEFDRGMQAEYHRRLRTPWRRDIVLKKAPPVMITVCAECEKMHTILFLTKDRWMCTHCRNEGKQSPTQIPITRPRRGK